MNRFPIYTPVKGFKGYYISEAGDLLKNDKSLYTNSRIDKNKHIKCSLIANQQRHTRYIHRLVAEHFIQNPENKKFVLHCNGNKHDNRVENLKWVTAYELIQVGKANRRLEQLVCSFIKGCEQLKALIPNKTIEVA